GVFLPPEGKDENYLKNILNLVPIKRKGEREELKKTLKFLIENEYLTGEIIYLDGGRHLGKALH
ncbi:MAG: dehydrogenase, partial [Thermoanaerobaculia bacterium]